MDVTAPFARRGSRRHMMRRRAPIAGIALAGLMVLAACAEGGQDEASGRTSATESNSPTTVRVAANGVTSDIGLFLAEEYGYFDKVNITMEFEAIRSAGDIIPMIADGAVDVYASAFSAGLVNAVQGGVDLKVVADKGRLTDGSSPSYGMMLVRSDVADEIKGPADFKGRAIAWGDPATASTMMLEQYLDQAGLTLDDVRLSTLSMPERIVALEQGAVDLANVFEPTGTQALEAGYAKLLFDLAEVSPGQQQAVLAVSGEWAEENEQAVTGFLSAYACGVAAYMEAVESGDGLEEMWAILERERGAYPEGLLNKAIPPVLDPESMPNVDNIQEQIDWYAEKKFIKRPMPAEDLVDVSYLENRIPCDELE